MAFLIHPQAPERDLKLERAIATASRLMASAETSTARRHHHDRWRRLLARRSPRRVREMQAALDRQLAAA